MPRSGAGDLPAACDERRHGCHSDKVAFPALHQDFPVHNPFAQGPSGGRIQVDLPEFFFHAPETKPGLVLALFRVGVCISESC